jgi:hypothetical protein
MIQGILRSTGHNIIIDGNFGPATEAAVIQYKATLSGATAGGAIDLETWRAIERSTGYRIINVVDAEDAEQRQRVMSGLSRAGAEAIIMYGMSNAVEQAISEVVSRAGASGVLAMVRFYSHGGPGAQGVALGHDGGMLQHMAGISAQHFPAMRAQFQRLNDVLAPFGCVDLMGCSVGSGHPGRTLLHNIADAAGRPAEAGIQLQYSQDVGNTVFNFEGPIRQVYPGHSSRVGWGHNVQAMLGR